MVNKPASAAKKAASDAGGPGRLKQIGMVAGILRKSNPKALPIVIGTAVLIIAAFSVAGVLSHTAPVIIPTGVLTGVAAAMIIFGRFAQTAQYAAISGQPGAAAAVLQSMRGNWTVTPTVSANRNMDVVHRAVGRPGVVLIGEGSPVRLPSLLAAEKKRIARIAQDVPIYDIQVGDEKGQLAIRQLQRHIMKLPRNIKGQAVADLNFRLKALPPPLQMPKGPLPRTGRIPKAPRPRTR
jgi:hypothetical protein